MFKWEVCFPVTKKDLEISSLKCSSVIQCPHSAALDHHKLLVAKFTGVSVPHCILNGFIHVTNTTIFMIL
jgi:hypothetical protein